MTSTKINNEKIGPVFPRPKREMDVYLPKVKGEEFFQIFSTDVDTIAEWFSGYEIDSMELKIDNIIHSSETTKLSRFEGRQRTESDIEAKTKDE